MAKFIEVTREKVNGRTEKFHINTDHIVMIQTFEDPQKCIIELTGSNRVIVNHTPLWVLAQINEL